MSDHIAEPTLSALADGELSPAELQAVQQHLAECLPCTSRALSVSLLKSAAARAGLRFPPPADLAASVASRMATLAPQPAPAHAAKPSHWWASPNAGLAAAALVLVAITASVVARGRPETEAQATEVLDQHIASLAANSVPQVVSSDRHTVKPWFQGKLPFSFNLPEGLPAGVTLNGANLTYIHGRPTAQLLYSIGKHHVSLFVRQQTEPPTQAAAQPAGGHSGFIVTGFEDAGLDVLAVSDVDPARLAELLTLFRDAQVQPANPVATQP
jgi:anti-sigma factor RsiW